MVLAPITGVFGLIAFSGKAGREAEQLAVLQPLASAYGDDWWFRMVFAFAQIELQDFTNGLRNIETALHGNPRNGHAAHIRGHLYYELGERREGLQFLSQWAKDYPKDAHIHCHISGHQAIWSLETGRREDAWSIYLRDLHPGGSWGPRSTFSPIAPHFSRERRWPGKRSIRSSGGRSAHMRRNGFQTRGSPLPILHSALAFAMSGDSDALRSLVDNPKGPAADILAPITRGFDAFARQRWNEAVQELQPVLLMHERVGGSRG